MNREKLCCAELVDEKAIDRVPGRDRDRKRFLEQKLTDVLRGLVAFDFQTKFARDLKNIQIDERVLFSGERAVFIFPKQHGKVAQAALPFNSPRFLPASIHIASMTALSGR